MRPRTAISSLSSIPLLMTVLVTTPLAGVDATPDVAPGASASDDWVRQWDRELAWTFAPAPGRIDPWYAYVLESDEGSSPPPPVPLDITARLVEARHSIAAAIAEHRWSDAIAAADASGSLAAGQVPRTAIQERSLAVIAALREQAEEGRAYDEAHAAFAAQGIKVQGILWSDSGTRLAMIDGEAHVLAIGDRLKDWSVAAIDSDRVIFRAPGRSHYEFTCFIGESAN